MEKIGSYINGNSAVVIYSDGTKERYIKDGDDPRPEFPESMDLKITNRCNAGCAMCAESSTRDGKHADLNNPILETIHPYTELAIGGGNPLEHPDLYPFLERMKQQKVICNLTVNQKHFLENIGLLRLLTDKGLIYGLGVSVVEPFGVDRLIEPLKTFPNAVIHTIAGYTPILTYQYLEYLSDNDINLLVLGYKDKGRGHEMLGGLSSHIERERDALETFLFDRNIKNRFKAVAFDNLAVKQLHVYKHISFEDLLRLYMGDDGEFTMYLDLVAGQYAKSSTHEPRPIDGHTIDRLFQNLKALSQ